MAGVARAEVTLDPPRAEVELGAAVVAGDLVRAIEAEGYGARPAGR